MLEFYPNPNLAHQGLLQGHHESLSNTLSCNGHGRTGTKYLSCSWLSNALYIMSSQNTHLHYCFK